MTDTPSGIDRAFGFLKDAFRQVKKGIEAAKSNDVIRVKDPSDTAAAPSHSSAQQAAQTNAVPLLISRSDNLLATLKDIVRHAEAKPDEFVPLDFLLASMLERSGLMKWDDTPQLSPCFLRRTEHHWLGSLDEYEQGDEIHTILASEAALALSGDLRTSLNERALSMDEHELRSHAVGLLNSIDQLDGKSSRKLSFHELTYPELAEAERPQEWLLREEFAGFFENVRLPIRLALRMKTNLEQGLVVVQLSVPAPEVFRILEADSCAPLWSNVASVVYACKSALLCARKLFDISPAVTTIIINCNHSYNDSAQTQYAQGSILSFELNRESCAHLSALVQSTAFSAESLSANVYATRQLSASDFGATELFSLPQIRAQLSSQGRLEFVEPFMELSDPRVNPPKRSKFPELMDGACSVSMQKLCHVDAMSDLGINEHAVLIDAWNKIEPTLTGSTSECVSAIMALHDSTSNLSLIDACERSSQFLIEAEREIAPKDLYGVFVHGSALNQAELEANALLEKEPPQAEEALSCVKNVLDPIDSVGLYLDDSDTVYRYFGSLAERLCYNQTNKDDRRKVSLVPDAYYNCHSLAAQCLTLLNKSEEALHHAEICSRIGPFSVDPVMRKLRILENDSRIFEAEKLICEWLPRASTPRDVALCHYRLAYMEWKLGRNDLAIACYRRSLEWQSPVRDQSRGELNELAQSLGIEDIPSLEEAKESLVKANIPLGLDKERIDDIAKMAVICVDDGLFTIARHYVSISIDIEGGDDELIDVYHWLAR